MTLITDVDLSRWLVGTGVLFVLMFIFYAVLLRIKQGSFPSSTGLPRRMRLLESLALGPKTRVHLVRIDHTDFILTQTEHGLELLEYADVHPLSSVKLPESAKQTAKPRRAA